MIARYKETGTRTGRILSSVLSMKSFYRLNIFITVAESGY